MSARQRRSDVYITLKKRFLHLILSVKYSADNAKSKSTVLLLNWCDIIKITKENFSEENLDATSDEGNVTLRKTPLITKM